MITMTRAFWLYSVILDRDRAFAIALFRTFRDKRYKGEDLPREIGRCESVTSCMVKQRTEYRH